MTYENPYGLGYERATEPGPDVEIYGVDKWCKKLPVRLHEKLDPQLIYRRPIKLQVGHRYVRRDGLVVSVLAYEPFAHYCMRYLCSDRKSRDKNGRYTGTKDSSVDLVTHIEEPETKEEPMNTVTVNNVPMTYAQIEAAHAEMMKQKAENEIKLGDIVIYEAQNLIGVVETIVGIGYRLKVSGFLAPKDSAKKVTGTPEFMAQLRAVLEGK